MECVSPDIVGLAPSHHSSLSSDVSSPGKSSPIFPFAQVQLYPITQCRILFLLPHHYLKLTLVFVSLYIYALTPPSPLHTIMLAL